MRERRQTAHPSYMLPQGLGKKGWAAHHMDVTVSAGCRATRIAAACPGRAATNQQARDDYAGAVRATRNRVLVVQPGDAARSGTTMP